MDNNLKHLHPVLQDIIPLFLTECHNEGFVVRIAEGYRDKDLQQLLYSQGRINDCNIIESHHYPYSMHNWGLAFTICRNDGKGLYNNHGLWFNQVGKIGIEHGLTWSENKKKYFQLSIYGDTPNKLIRKYGSPERFISSWGKNPSCPHKYYALSLKFKKPTSAWICSIQRILGIKRDKNDVSGILKKSIEINKCKNYNHPLVDRVQRRLIELEYYDKTRELTGIYDDYTKNCIIAVQKDIGLLECKCDGIIRKKDDVWKVLLGIIQK